MRYIFVSILLLLVAACGGGSGGDVQPTTANVTPTTASVTLATTGTQPIGKVLLGIGVTIDLPTGVAPKLDANGAVSVSVITPSGVMFNAATVLAPVYIPASGATHGTFSFAMVSSAVGGFGSGEFVTVSLQLAGGATATTGSFPLSGVSLIDSNGATVAGMGATVSGVTLY